jgi:hypothetical protein
MEASFPTLHSSMRPESTCRESTMTRLRARIHRTRLTLLMSLRSM